MTDQAQQRADDSHMIVEKIQVSGLQRFSRHLWKNALQHFLDGMASNTASVTRCPKINFRGLKSPLESVILRYCSDERTYYATGVNATSLPVFPADTTLMIRGREGEVEQGMIRFLSNGNIKALLIRLPYDSALNLWQDAVVCLWKSKGHLKIAACGIPTWAELYNILHDAP